MPNPATLGFGGIAKAADGKRYYFYDAQRPAGSLNEKISLDSARTIALPDNIDPSLAAALGVPGLAAYSAVVFSGQVQAGDSVLITGASAALTAAVFRDKLISIIRHTNFLLRDNEATEAYYNPAQLATEGKVTMPSEAVTLDGLPEVWTGLVSKKLRGKYVVSS